MKPGGGFAGGILLLWVAWKLWREVEDERRRRALEHVWVLVVGLVLSVAFMGAAAAIATLLNRYHWIAYVGTAIIAYVALIMIWDEGRSKSWTPSRERRLRPPLKPAAASPILGK